MLSLNNALNYCTWFYFWWTQDGAAQRGTPGYNGTLGYCVVHQIHESHIIFCPRFTSDTWLSMAKTLPIINSSLLREICISFRFRLTSVLSASHNSPTTFIFMFSLDPILGSTSCIWWVAQLIKLNIKGFFLSFFHINQECHVILSLLHLPSLLLSSSSSSSSSSYK